MLPQNRRINTNLFKILLKEGKSYFNPPLSVRVSRHPDQPTAFAFVVSSKEVKLAVKRNFLKRRGRAVIRKHLNEIKSGYLCAFFFKKELSKLSFPEFERKMLDSLAQANLLQ